MSQVEVRVPVLKTALAVFRVCFPLQDAEALRHVVELLSGYLDTFSSRWTTKHACSAGLPRWALEYLVAHGRDLDWRTSEDDAWWLALKAMRKGYLHVLEWMCERHPDSIPWGHHPEAFLLDSAAHRGRLAILKWLHANHRKRCTPDAMDLAAKEGHLDVVRWLHKNRREGCTYQAMDYAAEGGHLEVVRFLHVNRREGCTWRAMDSASANGHLAVVKFLHRYRREGCSSEAMRKAAAFGHLEVVQWLGAYRSEGNLSEALRSAARWGRVAVVEWLAGIVRGQLPRRRGDDRICAAAQEASRAGKIEVAELLEKMLKRPRLE